jgi:cysteinyl-tRNA synthetase
MRSQSGVVPTGFLVDVSGEEDVPSDVKQLLMERMQAREQKNYKLADSYRDKIKARGYRIEDTPKGPQLRRV